MRQKSEIKKERYPLHSHSKLHWRRWCSSRQGRCIFRVPSLSRSYQANMDMDIYCNSKKEIGWENMGWYLLWFSPGESSSLRFWQEIQGLFPQDSLCACIDGWAKADNRGGYTLLLHVLHQQVWKHEASIRKLRSQSLCKLMQIALPECNSKAKWDDVLKQRKRKTPLRALGTGCHSGIESDRSGQRLT